ncbi:hypothetical protein RCL1_005215 [Eukaryota sp. TZLM3-RCL]
MSRHGPSSSGERRSVHSKTYWDYRLDKLKKQSEDRVSSLFSNLVFYFNGRNGTTIGSYHLGKMAHRNGALVTPHLSASVTHVICSNLSYSKTKDALLRNQPGRKSKIKFVTGQWVVDCIDNGELISTSSYSIIPIDKKQNTLFNYFKTNKISETKK